MRLSTTWQSMLQCPGTPWHCSRRSCRRSQKNGSRPMQRTSHKGVLSPWPLPRRLLSTWPRFLWQMVQSQKVKDGQQRLTMWTRFVSPRCIVTSLFSLFFLLLSLVFQDWEALNGDLHSEFGTSTSKRDLSGVRGAEDALQKIDDFLKKHPHSEFDALIQLWVSQLSAPRGHKRRRVENEDEVISLLADTERVTRHKVPFAFLFFLSFLVLNFVSSYFHVTRRRLVPAIPLAMSLRSCAPPHRMTRNNRFPFFFFFFFLFISFFLFSFLLLLISLLPTVMFPKGQSKRATCRSPGVDPG